MNSQKLFSEMFWFGRTEGIYHSLHLISQNTLIPFHRHVFEKMKVVEFSEVWTSLDLFRGSSLFKSSAMLCK